MTTEKIGLNFLFKDQKEIIKKIKEKISEAESEIQNNVWWGSRIRREHFIKAHHSALQILESDKPLNAPDIIKEYINYKENKIYGFIEDYKNTLIAVGHCPSGKQNVRNAVSNTETLEETIDRLYVKT